MARLQEIPFIVRRIGAYTFAKRVVSETLDDGVFNMAAAVAFYWLLAIVPLLIFLLTLAPLMPANAKDRTVEKAETWVRANLPKEGADPIVENVKDVVKHPRGGLLSIGLLLTLWAASNGMNATMTALDRCYDITRPRHFLIQRGVALLVTIGFVIVALVVVLLVPVSSIILNVLDNPGKQVPGWAIGGSRFLIDTARYAIGVTLVICIVSSVYQFGGSVRRRWTLITPGAVFTVFGIIAMAYGFNWYIQSFGAHSYNKMYGSLGGFVILLLTLYLYACVFLIGAEVNSEIDYIVLGSKSAEPPEPLPRLHPREDLDRFRKALEARQRVRESIQR